jgi:hypothetical protein
MNHFRTTASPAASTCVRGSRRRDVECAAAALIRAAMAPDWSPAVASAMVRSAARDDRNVLLVLRARVAQQLARAWTPVGQRAAETVDAALAAPAAVSASAA